MYLGLKGWPACGSASRLELARWCPTHSLSASDLGHISAFHQDLIQLTSRKLFVLAILITGLYHRELST